jgi:U3 small nucleolar RNA-associated protein 21
LLTKTPHVVITALAHPSTYLNKFVIGFSDGSLELWNFNTKKMLYSFQSHCFFFDAKKTSSSTSSNGYDSDDDNINNNNNRNDDSSSGSSSTMYGISCLEQSPACDVMALGLMNGYILLLNLKLDQILFSFLQKGGSVTSLSFRTDAASDRYPYLVSGSEDGRMHVWNLGSNNDSSKGYYRNGNDDDDDNDVDIDTSSRKLQCSIDEGHVGAISRVAFVYGESTMISIGRDDNSIKVWIFDAPDGTARLLRSREGHRLPSTRIRYYGGTTNVSMRDNADGMSCELISASNDGTLRLFNTAIENQNRELSQKPILKKLGLLRRHERLPECINFDFCETRQRDWGNLVTIHYNHEYAYVWKFKHRVITEMILKPSNTKINHNIYYKDNNKITSSIALSPCGNYCVIGMKGGLIHQYNLQSGLHRNTFPILTNDYDYNSAAGMDEKEFKKRSLIPGNVYHETKLILGEQMKPLNTVIAVVDDDDDDSDRNKIGSSSSNAGVDASSTSSNNNKVITGHNSEVSGLFIDMLSITLISCGYDGLICFWNFQTHHLMHHIQLDSPQIMMHGFRDSNFVAIVSQDSSIIRLYDIQTYSLLRRFSNGHSREITDLAFSIDGRRLLSSSLDCTLRVWDIPTGRCLSWLLFDSYIQSMCISLSGEYLCIVQAEKQGIQMYIDRSLYETIYIDKEPTSPMRIASSVVRMDPSIDEIRGPKNHQDRSKSSTYNNDNDDDYVDNDDNDGNDDNVATASATSIKPAQAHIQATDGINIEDNNNSNLSSTTRGPIGTITYSSIPKAYWTSLFNLEAIKQRNQPILPPAPPPKVPFFLPSIIRNGATTPSFPTPAEYAELTNNLSNKKDIMNASTKGIIAVAAVKGEVGVGEKRMIGDDNDRTIMKKSKRDVHSGITITTTTDNEGDHDNKNDDNDGNDDILKSMEGLGSVWVDTNDDNDGNGDGGVSWVIDRSPSTKAMTTSVSSIIDTTTSSKTAVTSSITDIDGKSTSVSVDAMMITNHSSDDKTKKSKSKIISKKTKLPR